MTTADVLTFLDRQTNARCWLAVLDAAAGHDPSYERTWARHSATRAAAIRRMEAIAS